MILKLPLVYKVHSLWHTFLNLMSRQILLAYHQDGLQLHHLLVEEKKSEQESNCVSDCVRDLHRPSLNLLPFQWSDGEDDDQPPQGERQRQRSRSREGVYPHEQVPQEPQIQPMVTPGSDDEISDKDFAIIDPSSPSSGPPHSAEQRNRFRRFERSRPTEYIHVHPRMLQEYSRIKQLRAKMKIQQPWVHRIVWVIIQGQPQDQEDTQRQGPQTPKGKTITAEKQPSTPPKAKNYKPTNSYEDDEESQKMSLEPLLKLSGLLY